MIPVRVDQLFLSNMGFVVVLKSEQDARYLPIFIGAAEAQVIALWLNKIHVPRPMTHDLLKNLLDCLETRMMRVDVCDLKEGTFFAQLVLLHDGMELKIDARPSDAIALALRGECPIFVAEAVMVEAGRIFEETEKGLQEISAKETAGAHADTHKTLSPLEALERKLQKAIEDERYEDAAGLRDEIKHLKESHGEN